MFQYRKRYGLHAICGRLQHVRHTLLFQYRKRYGLHAIENNPTDDLRSRVSIPQAVWIACNFTIPKSGVISRCFNTASGMDCMQFARTMVQDRRAFGFNTASGMDCMQFHYSEERRDFPLFQYRKRYGLHAIRAYDGSRSSSLWFQYRKRYGLHAMTRFTSVKVFDLKFQYRKRYGLHAILF